MRKAGGFQGNRSATLLGPFILAVDRRRVLQNSLSSLHSEVYNYGLMAKSQHCSIRSTQISLKVIVWINACIYLLCMVVDVCNVCNSPDVVFE